MPTNRCGDENPNNGGGPDVAESLMDELAEELLRPN
jgi:hypothetical protein